MRPFLYLYAVSDTILLHISATPRRRDIPVSCNSFIWILRTAPANFICPCYSFVHMVGENESQNEKMENETISFSIFNHLPIHNRNLRLILFIQMLQIMLCLCRDHAGEQQHSDQVRDGHECIQHVRNRPHTRSSASTGAHTTTAINSTLYGRIAFLPSRYSAARSP